VDQEERAIKASGWSLSSTPNHKLEVHVNSFNPIAASCHINLPKFIKKKRAILNIKNEDQKCFLYAVLAKLNPLIQNTVLTKFLTTSLMHMKYFPFLRIIILIFL